MKGEFRREERKTTALIIILLIGFACFIAIPAWQQSRPPGGALVQRFRFSRAVRLKVKPDKTGRLMFVHVGKTGGSSVEEFLKANEIRYFMVHQKPLSLKICRSTGYSRLSSCASWVKRWQQKLRVVVVSVRDPLKRLVSAFNWRNPDGGGVTHNYYVKHYWPQVHRFEKQLYSCFQSVNALAEALDSSGVCGDHARKAVQFRPSFYGTHMTQGYQFYFGGGVLETMIQRNISIYLVHQETMADDLEGIQTVIPNALTTHNVFRERSNYLKKNDTQISEEGLRKLAPYLSDEYSMLARLEAASVNRS